MSSTKRIIDLVYSGKVMDDHGNWIPIAEQLRKEKRFLHHLEQGEILVNGTWLKMSDYKNISSTPSKKTAQKNDGQTGDDETTQISPLTAPPPEETVSFSLDTIFDVSVKHLDPRNDSGILIRTPEETVSFSTDTIRDFPSEAFTSDTGVSTEFPPETKSLLFEPADTSDETESFNRSDGTLSKTQSDFGTTEFEETVMYNIKMLENTLPSRKMPDHSPSKPPPEALQPLSSKQSRANTRFPGSLLVFISILIILLIVLLRLFL